MRLRVWHFRSRQSSKSNLKHVRQRKQIMGANRPQPLCTASTCSPNSLRTCQEKTATCAGCECIAVMTAVADYADINLIYLESAMNSKLAKGETTGWDTLPGFPGGRTPSETIGSMTGLSSNASYVWGSTSAPRTLTGPTASASSAPSLAKVSANSTVSSTTMYRTATSSEPDNDGVRPAR